MKLAEYALQPVASCGELPPTMNRYSLVVSVLAAVVSLAGAAEPAPVALFDGKSLAGWTNPYSYGKAEVVDGEIQLTAEKKFFLMTEKSFGDFIFEGEVQLPERFLVQYEKPWVTIFSETFVPEDEQIYGDE